MHDANESLRQDIATLKATIAQEVIAKNTWITEAQEYRAHLSDQQDRVAQRLHAVQEEMMKKENAWRMVQKKNDTLSYQHKMGKWIDM